jgi:hypothetical protein
MMKLKFNWGTGIAVFIGIFLLANAFVIYKSTQQRYDLVDADYYPQGLEYQKQIDRFANANSLSAGIRIEPEGSGVSIAYPPEFKGRTIKGKVLFFRPSDENADFSDSIAFDSTLIQHIGGSKFLKGKYIAKFFWLMDGKEYAHEMKFRMN